MSKAADHKKLQTAFSVLQAGNPDKAADLFRQILGRDPNNFQALYYLGIAEARRGNLRRAGSAMARALSVEPTNVPLLENYATILMQTGDFASALQASQQVLRLDADSVYSLHLNAASLFKLNRLQEALVQFDRLLALEPNHFVGLNGRGSALAELGNHDAALESFEKAIRLQPQFAEAHLNKGNLYAKLGRRDDALAAYDRALALRPDLADAWLGRGNVLRELRRHDEACAAFDKALAILPGHAAAWLGRGNTSYDLKRHGEALAAYDKALALRPDLAEGWLGRGNILVDLGRYDEALAVYDKTLALKPDLIEAWLGRVSVFRGLRRYDEALKIYDNLLTLRPDLSEAWFGRGDLLDSLGRYDEAFAAYDKARALKPDLAYAEGARLHAKMQLCDWADIVPECDHLIWSVRNNRDAVGPFAFIGISASSEDQMKCARLWAARKCPPSDRPIWQGGRYAHSHIRVAYLSADFRDHPVSYLMAGVFEQHDRGRFETFGISFGPDDRSGMRARLKAAFGQFLDVAGQSDVDVANLLRTLEVDIAVDLMGHTANSRTAILAHRPAPIQVNYLGFPGTMGADYIDYLIADPVLVPSSYRTDYAEKIAYLPNSYMPHDESGRIISGRQFSRAEFGLPQKGFVFCGFNNTYKLNPETFDCWARILRNVEGSVLWLSVSNATAIANLRKEAELRGIRSDRLVFAGRLPSAADHLARHQLADLFLDALPYNAHTTASDALWAGLPVVTRVGQTFAGRVAASLLSAVGLPELITQTQDEYEQLAIELATNPGRLSSVKEKLMQNRRTAPLFDTKLITRHIEAAYVAMYKLNESGSAPDHIQISA